MSALASIPRARFLLVVHCDNSFSMICENTAELLRMFTHSMYGERWSPSNLQLVVETLADVENWTIAADGLPFHFSRQYDDFENAIFQVYRITN